jgi:2-oxo-4-hydroxy-4-carboxy--5-ureidoimidazoline (OHCU) decarboxylase
MTAVPGVADLDALAPDACAAALAPLFEGAPRFLARLAAARPFGDADALWAKAREIARAMPEPEQVELIDAHPRLGAPPGSVSALSFLEQGFDRDAAGAAAEAERERIDRELARLNAAYEATFGFSYCVFVAGRPRAALLPGLEAALGADRGGELRRALDAVVDIAADRYRTLRSDGQNRGR